MSIFEKLNLNILDKSDTLTNWNSRKYCKLKLLNTELVEKVQHFIETYDSYKIYNKCFLNNVFITEIANCFDKSKEFINCEFEITQLFQCASFIKDFNFKNCTFYITDYDDECVTFTLYTNIKEKLFSQGNKVIKSSYIEYLSKKFSNDLRKAPSRLLDGISINYSDLSETILPDNVNFFDELSDTEIHHIKFNVINFNMYSTRYQRFSNIIFKPNTVLSEEMISNGLFNCTLPVIDFRNFNKSKFGSFKFYECKFKEGTIFPSYENFFLECTIRNSFLPTFDYSNYNVSDKTFFKCSFTNESKIPNKIFTTKNIKALDNVLNIPPSYLNSYILFGKIDQPILFLNKYFKFLSKESLFVLSKKYCLVLKNTSNIS